MKKFQEQFMKYFLEEVIVKITRVRMQGKICEISGQVSKASTIENFQINPRKIF